MTTHEVLVSARNLIADEKNWHQSGSPGINCASTAIHELTGIHHPARRPARVALAQAMGLPADEDPDSGPTLESIYVWNDSHTHAEVLAAFDKAIASTAPQPDTSFLAEVEEAIPA